MNSVYLCILLVILFMSGCSKSDNSSNNSIPIRDTITIKAWVGENGSTLSISENLLGAEIYSSNDENCDTESYGSCSNGELHIINGNPIEVISLDIKSKAHFSIVEKGSTTRFMLGASNNYTPVGNRHLRTISKLNNKLYSIQGAKDGVTTRNLWSSYDGTSWSKESDAVPFNRANSQIILFNEKLWLIGGRNKQEYFGDIWSSSNGKDWTLEVDKTPFSLRDSFQLFEFNGKLWIIGGIYSNDIDLITDYSDIWTSNDGVQWQQESKNSNLTLSNMSQVVQHHEKLWVFDNLSIKSSSDGIIWNAVSLPYLSETVQYPTLSTFRNNLVLVGGRKQIIETIESFREISYEAISDVLSSSDGIKWTKSTTPTGFSPRTSPAVYHVNNTLFVGSGIIQRKADILASSDGQNWIKTKPSVDSPNSRINTISFNNKLYSFNLSLNGLSTYTSENGQDWRLQATDSSFHDSFYPYFLELNDTLIYLGKAKNTTTLNSARTSENGINWKESTITPSLPEAKTIWDLTAFTFSQKAWLYISHYKVKAEDNIRVTSIYSSSNGINWIKEGELSGLEFEQFSNMKFAELDGKLWALSNGSNSYTSSYRSSDALTWTKLSEEIPFYVDELASHNNSLWAIDRSNKKLWSSSDGIEWTQDALLKDEKFKAFTNFSLTSHKGELYFTNNYLYSDTWKLTESGNWYQSLIRSNYLNN